VGLGGGQHVARQGRMGRHAGLTKRGAI
jgi:hypothetical protein